MRWTALLLGLLLAFRPAPAPAAQACPGVEIGSASCCCCGPDAECCCWEADPRSVPPPAPAKVASSSGDTLVAEEPAPSQVVPRVAAATTAAPLARPCAESPPAYLLGCSLLC